MPECLRRRMNSRIERLKALKPARHGSTTESVLDFSTNMYPVSLPAEIVNAINSTIARIGDYPDADCTILRDIIAKHFSCSKENVIAGNGCTELIRLISWCLGEGTTFIPQPTFSEYEYSILLYEGDVSTTRISKEDDFLLTENVLKQMPEKTKLVFLCNPNNPTGRVIPEKLLISFLEDLAERNIILVLDEVYYDLSDSYTLVDRAADFENLIVLRSLTKSWGMCGLRLGYAIADNSLIQVLDKARPPWNVNTLAQEAGKLCIGSDYLDNLRQEAGKSKRELEKSLKKMLGFHVYPSEASFFLINIKETGHTSQELADKLLNSGVCVRDCSSFQYLDNDYIRVGVKTSEMNKILIEKLEEVLI